MIIMSVHLTLNGAGCIRITEEGLISGECIGSRQYSERYEGLADVFQ